MAMEAADGLSLTYGELFERSARAANALVELGVAPGDRVAVQIDKSPDMIVVMLACLRAGAVLLPLNTAYTLAELEYFLSDAKPALTLCRPAMLDAVRALAQKLGLPAVESLGASRDGGFAERIAASPAAFETAPRASDDLAAILYTSGTTGRSKGAMLTHDNLASNALALIDVWRFTSADVSDPRVAGVPYAWIVRRDQCRADERGDDDLPAALRCGRDRRRAAARDQPDGRADLLCPPPRSSRRHARIDRAYAAVRLGLGAIARRDARGLARQDRARDSRALWDDRDQYDHVEPL